MNKPTSLAYAVSAAIALTASQAALANEGPTIYGALYGKSHIAYTKTTNKQTNTSTKKTTRLQANDDGSRIGIRGGHTLNDTYKLSYRLEWRSPVDTEARSLEPRDMWVGLTHNKYGTVKAGRMLTPEPYIEYAPQTSIVDGNRTNNSIRYESPVFNNTQVMVQYIMDESGKNKDGGSNDSLGTDGYAVSINHEKANQYALGAAYFYADANTALHGHKAKDQFRISGYYYATPKLKLSSMYQQNRFNDTDKPLTEKGLSFNAEYQTKPDMSVYGLVGATKNNYGKDEKYYFSSVGLNKTFSSNVTGGAELELSRTDNSAERKDSATLYVFGGYRF